MNGLPCLSLILVNALEQFLSMHKKWMNIIAGILSAFMPGCPCLKMRSEFWKGRGRSREKARQRKGARQILPSVALSTQRNRLV